MIDKDYLDKLDQAYRNVVSREYPDPKIEMIRQRIKTPSVQVQDSDYINTLKKRKENDNNEFPSYMKRPIIYDEYEDSKYSNRDPARYALLLAKDKALKEELLKNLKSSPGEKRMTDLNKKVVPESEKKKHDDYVYTLNTIVDRDSDDEEIKEYERVYNKSHGVKLDPDQFRKDIEAARETKIASADKEDLMHYLNKRYTRSRQVSEDPDRYSYYYDYYGKNFIVQ